MCKDSRSYDNNLFFYLLLFFYFIVCLCEALWVCLVYDKCYINKVALPYHYPNITIIVCKYCVLFAFRNLICLRRNICKGNCHEGNAMSRVGWRVPWHPLFSHIVTQSLHQYFVDSRSWVWLLLGSCRNPTWEVIPNCPILLKVRSISTANSPLRGRVIHNLHINLFGHPKEFIKEKSFEPMLKWILL